MNRKVGNRILALVMLLSIVSTVVTGSLALFVMGGIKNTVSNLPEEMKKQLVKENEAEYIRNGEEEIKSSLTMGGEVFDSLLKNMSENTKDLAKSINKYYADTEKYEDSGKRVYEPDINGSGYSAQVIYETDIDKEKIRSSVRFSANAAGHLLEMSRSDENIISTFMSMERGFTLFADNNPQGKFNSKGGVIQYNARAADWYKTVKSTQRGVFTGIGYDKWGENPCVMYGYPITGGGFRGAVCIKYALTPALERLAFDNTTVIIYDSQGNITYSNAEEGTAFAKGNTLPGEFSALMNGADGLNQVNTVEFGNANYRAACYKTTSGEITIACLKTDEDIYNSAVTSGKDIKEGAQAAAKGIYRTICISSLILVLIILLVIALSVKFSASLARSIVVPVKTVTNGLECVTEGNFEYRVTPEGDDELRELADSFNNLGYHIGKMVEDAKLEVYEYEKQYSEFNICTRVQRDSNNVAFPESDNYEIFASVKPAKFVCSDFVDSFEIDSNHMAFCMVDANAGGIDATFTAKIIKELIKAHSVTGESPYEVLTNVNAQMNEMQKGDIKASVFLGILEVSSGKVVYVNAGFDTIFVKRAELNDFENINSQGNPRVMVASDTLYVQESMMLKKGDTLYIPSDGILGAVDEKYEKYSLEQLKTVITEYERKPMDHLLNFVHDDVRKFVKGAPQLDDISLLILKIK